MTCLLGLTSSADAEAPARPRALLKEMAGLFENLNVRLQASLAQPLDGADVRGDLAVELASGTGHWWQLGLTALAVETVTSVSGPGVDFRRTIVKRDVLALSVRRFERLGPTVWSVGLVEDHLGASAELRALDDRVRLELLLHGWSPRGPDRRPRLRAGGSVQWRWLFIQAGLEDALDGQARTPFLGMGLRWRDPDLLLMAFWLSRL